MSPARFHRGFSGPPAIVPPGSRQPTAFRLAHVMHRQSGNEIHALFVTTIPEGSGGLRYVLSTIVWRMSLKITPQVMKSRHCRQGNFGSVRASNTRANSRASCPVMFKTRRIRHPGVVPRDEVHPPTVPRRRTGLRPLLLLPAGLHAQQSTSSTPQAQPATGQAQEPDPLKRERSDKERFAARKEVKKELKDAYRNWLEQDVTYIISDDERKAFKNLSNDEEREAFIEQFWLRRNPNPDSPENEFREEHYRRIAYANEHYAAGKPGWKTDRGHIYIAFGKPDSIESHPSGGSYQRPMDEGGGETSTFPFETWHYRYLEGIGENVDLEFVDTCMCGDYHFTIDRGEKDALQHVPGMGLTQWEEMGQAKKADRFKGGFENLGTGPLGSLAAVQAV